MPTRRLALSLVALSLLGVGCSGAAKSTSVPGAAPSPNTDAHSTSGGTNGGSFAGSAGGSGSGTHSAGTSGGGATYGGSGAAGASGSYGSAAGGSYDSVGATGTTGATPGATGGTSGTAGSSGSSGSTSSSSSSGTTGLPLDPNADALTAGAWDDNANFDFYLGYLADPTITALPGLPQIPRSDRLQIQVTDGAGHLVSNAAITVTQGQQTLFVGQAGADGIAYAFPTWLGGSATDVTVTAEAAGYTASAVAHAGDHKLGVVLAGAQPPLPQVLDLALVLDTTGSMGDEINYLQLEIANIAQDIEARYPNVQQRYALVLYRDHDPGDAYAVRTFDFTTDLGTFQTELNSQGAGGGGDYEEQPELGLDSAMNLQWSTGPAARMIFHVADAPTHIGSEDALAASIKRAYLGGVRIFPVAASGVDDRAEYSMRSEAEVTGGRYLFLTDDSGIGDSHKEPRIPCYFVTSLRSAMLRMVSMELSGQHIDPAPSEVIRTGGDPQNNRCTLQSGTVVVAL